MTEEEKMIWLYEQVDGKLDTRTGCSLVVRALDPDDWDSEMVLSLMKDGNVCWSLSKTDLVFDYITRDL